MKKFLLFSFLAFEICANAQCEPIDTFPVNWGFEGLASPNLPACWTVAGTGQSNNWNTWTSDGNSGTSPGTNLLNNAIAANAIGSSWAFTRPFALTAGHEYTVKFISLATNNSNPRILRIAYGAVASDAGMTTVVGTDETLTQAHENKTYTFTAAVSGNYYLGFNVYNTTATTQQTSVLVDDITVNDESLAIADFNSKSNIKVYPNPVNDVLKISDISKVKSITVNDISGRQIKTFAPSSEINLSSLESGSYIVSLAMDNGSIQNIKTIKR